VNKMTTKRKKTLIDLIRDPRSIFEVWGNRKLQKTPRYTPTTANLLSKQIQVLDAASYLFQKSEIFDAEIYKFSVAAVDPYIIDAGANIGMSAIFFKHNYPRAKVVAFEPDPKVFKVLNHNVKEVFGFNDVELIPKGVWNSNGSLEFMSEGSDGGRVQENVSHEKKIAVEVVRLRDYLAVPVDFLKIDIEGSETTVLQDCADLLVNVRSLFIEYHSFVDQPQTLHLILDILNRAGFRYYVTKVGLESARPLLMRRNQLGMDSQLNIIAVRS
jgi:FkbM family methyltransferase